MRNAVGVGAVLAIGLLAAPLAAQAPKYWPQLEIGFPVPTMVLDLNPKPAKLRLYAAGANGKFERVSELSVDRLQPIPNRKPGFQYTARGDGEEEFAVQLVAADGTVTPSDDKLRGEFKVIFDTRPPNVTLSSLGVNGVQWNASDENLESGSIKLENRWLGSDGRWNEVKTKTFNSRDEYSWPSLAKDNRTLEVRVSAKDKAGHETVSRIVKLPESGGGGRQNFDTVPLRNTDTGAGRDLDTFPNSQSQIVYVNRRDLQVRSKLTHVTRSGISKVHLYVKDLSANSGGEWKLDKTQTCDIKFEATDTTVEIPYVAPKDGRYGFIVIPESGVGRREAEPRSAAPPQHLVEVDTVKPNVKIRTVTVSPGGTIGPRVEVEWDADDRNLMPDPIVLEYAASKDALSWTSIAEKIPNSRRYVWEVSDKTMFKLYVRARATDKATNVGEHAYDQAVIVDLDKPAATIDNIRGSGSAPPSSSDKLPSPGIPSGGIALPSIGAPALVDPGR